jgi:O-antigen/teichoic acid export membrane protein
LSAIRKFAGQTAIYGISTIVSRVLNFFLTPVYVRVYPAKVYGIFTTMYSWASLLNAVLSFGMETTFFRYLHKHEGDREKVYSNTFLAVASVAFIFLLGTIFFVDDIALWIQDGSVSKASDYALYVKYFIWILVTDALAVIPFAKVRADERPMRYGMIRFANILSSIGFNLFFIFGIPFVIHNNWFGASFLAEWYRPGWVGYVFISNLIASIITLLLLLPELVSLKFDFEWKLIKNMLLYSFPLLIANISFVINENVDKIFLGKLLPASISAQEVGIYGACSKLAIFLSIAVQAFRLGAEPFFFSHAKNKNAREVYSKIMTYFVIAVSIVFVALVANIEILKYFIKGNDPLYWSGLGIVPILLFGYACLGIYMNLSIWYKLSDQTRYGLYISGAGALLTIVLNIIFIPRYSYLAAAWISLTAYVTMMILSYVLGQRNYPIPYNLRKNLAYLVSSVILVVFSFIIFNRSIIIGNLLLMLFALGIVFFERKELKLLLKRQ